MIVKKMWHKKGRASDNFYFKEVEGWFLFGIIPIYIRDMTHIPA